MGSERVQKNNSSWQPAFSSGSNEKKSKAHSFGVTPESNGHTSAPPKTSAYSSYALT